MTLPPDWSGSERYWATDLAPGLTAPGGRLTVPTAAGCGATVDEAAVDAATERWVELAVG